MNREIPTRDAIDEIEDEMMADWQEVADGVLGAVESVIEAAESYEDLLARLPETLRHMPTALVVDTLVKGMFKARSTGDQKDG
jgi:phage gp29-like protein